MFVLRSSVTPREGSERRTRGRPQTSVAARGALPPIVDRLSPPRERPSPANVFTRRPHGYMLEDQGGRMRLQARAGRQKRLGALGAVVAACADRGRVRLVRQGPGDAQLVRVPGAVGIVRGRRGQAAARPRTARTTSTSTSSRPPPTSSGCRWCAGWRPTTPRSTSSRWTSTGRRSSPPRSGSARCPPALAAQIRSVDLPGPVRTATALGKIYAVPINSNTQLLWYRKDLLAKIGKPVPKTWNEMIDDSILLAQKGLPALHRGAGRPIRGPHGVVQLAGRLGRRPDHHPRQPGRDRPVGAGGGLDHAPPRDLAGRRPDAQRRPGGSVADRVRGGEGGV